MCAQLHTIISTSQGTDTCWSFRLPGAAVNQPGAVLFDRKRSCQFMAWNLLKWFVKYVGLLFVCEFNEESSYTTDQGSEGFHTVVFLSRCLSKLTLRSMSFCALSLTKVRLFSSSMMLFCTSAMFDSGAWKGKSSKCEFQC